MVRMDVEEATRRFAELFAALYRRFYRRVAVGEYRLTSESLAILQHLADAGPLTVGEAARHMARSQAAMSELIKRLVDRGMLDRMPDERDRRRVLIWLTGAGRETLATAKAVLSHELLAGALAQMPGESRRRMIERLETLLDTEPRGTDDE